MISQKYKDVAFAFFMSLIMSLVISIFNTGIGENGLADNIIVIWLQDWLFAFVIALPTILLISSIVVWLVSLVVQTEQS